MDKKAGCLTLNKAQVTVGIIGGIIAILTPIIVIALSVKQTEQNTKDIASLQVKFEEVGNNISSINTNIVWIKEALKIKLNN